MESKNAGAQNETIDAMFKAGAHFGYPKSRRHPSIRSFIFGAKNRTEIIDLEQVAMLLGKAEEFVRTVGSQGKQIVFVGNKPEARAAVEKAAIEIAMPYARERWIGGTFTNFPEIKKRIARLEDLENKKAKGELSVYTKKEQLILSREIEKLKRFFIGIVPMRTLPAAIFIVDPKKESTAVSEANKLGIPVIALAGSDCDISNITYPIVANDASISSISFFVDRIKNAYLDGKKNPAVVELNSTSNEHESGNHHNGAH
jgi:small subunit ribosomal protein S2